MFEKFSTIIIILDFKQNPAGRTTDLKAVSMFSKVELSARLKLYDLYKIDFELFEYSADKYLQQT